MESQELHQYLWNSHRYGWGKENLELPAHRLEKMSLIFWQEHFALYVNWVAGNFFAFRNPSLYPYVFTII